MGTRLFFAAAVATLTALSGKTVVANPIGSSVTAGSASVAGGGTANVTINQSTDKAIIEWTQFDIGAGETTLFKQPNASSVTLNRVVGGGASVINGSLKANGSIFLINPDGILFGASSKVDVGGLVATTNDIDNSDFMAGRYAFTRPGRSDASIVNAGSITATTGGFAALVAPGVRNSGTITAKLGHVGLSSANAFALDFYGDDLISLSVDAATAATVRDAETGETLDALVKNSGRISADGGTVQLTAAAARKVVDSVINNTGVIEANSVGGRNGRIVLGAATTSSNSAGLPTQRVKVSGKLSVAGTVSGDTGGKIQITGEAIGLAVASLDASGAAGGGTVLVGGDTGGGKPATEVAGIAKAKLEATPVAIASTVIVDGASSIDASATQTGDGGKVVVWADDATTFQGAVRASGGKAGAGGFVEVSGKSSLDFGGSVELAGGRSQGTLLLDPGSININASGTDTTTATTSPGETHYLPTTNFSVLKGSTLLAALASANVIVSTGDSSANSNVIAVNTPLTWNSGHSLTLADAGLIAIFQPITASNGGLTIAGSDSIGATAAVNVHTFRMESGNWIQAPLAPGTPVAFHADDFQLVGGTFKRFNGGDGSIASPYRVFDIYGLQGLGGSENYVLANNISAGETASWNGGMGFVPINLLQGVFDGANHAITGLKITNPGPFVGLFGSIDDTGSVRNISLADISVTNISSSGFPVGALAGVNRGAVTGVAVSGVVLGTGPTGGLVGVNEGHISGSFTAGTVALPTTTAPSLLPAAVGGLVGLDGIANPTVGFRPGYIDASYSTAAVSSAYVASYVGGLVGQQTGGAITNSYATGNVTAPGNTIFGGIPAVGGLVGQNMGGGLSNDYATGSITGGAYATVGGLVGRNCCFDPSDLTTSTLIANSHATGAVRGGVGSFVGGLVGNNQGTVTGSYATGNVQAETNSLAGGLVGVNNNQLGGGSGVGMILRSYSTGNVVSSGAIAGGGLAGFNVGVITEAFTSSAVTGGPGSSIGGLVGLNEGLAPPLTYNSYILRAYSTGPVSAGANSWVGGLVGTNAGYITEAYATGQTTAGSGSSAGGLVALGNLVWGPPPAISVGVVVNSYWDTQTTGRSSSVGGTGRSTAQLKGALPAGFDPASWAIVSGAYPRFSWQGQSAIAPADPYGTSQTQSFALANGQVVSYSLPTQAPHPSSPALPPMGAVSIPSLVTAAGQSRIEGVQLWTGGDGATSAYELLQSMQPFVAWSDAAYHPGASADWTHYLSQVGVSDSDIALFKSWGFDAAVDVENGRVILAFAGSTTSWHDIPATFVDWVGTNIPNLLHTQGSSAGQFQYIVAYALAQAVRRAKPNVPIYVTGHSLGGSLAAYVGATLNMPAVTFNPEGVTFAPGEAHNDAMVLNLQIATDIVGAGGALIGTTIVYDKQLLYPGADKHDLKNFIDLAYSSYSRKLAFTGSAAKDLTGPIKHTGAMFFVSKTP
ncbi:MAG: filamentous hemagglutinin N-terminal domain-containing protein [Bauldia sp.]